MPDGNISPEITNMGNPESDRTGIRRLEPDKNIVGRVAKQGKVGGSFGFNPNAEQENLAQQMLNPEMKQHIERSLESIMSSVNNGELRYNLFASLYDITGDWDHFSAGMLKKDLAAKARGVAKTVDPYVYEQVNEGRVIDLSKTPEEQKETARIFQLFLIPEDNLIPEQKKEKEEIRGLLLKTQNEVAPEQKQKWLLMNEINKRHEFFFELDRMVELVDKVEKTFLSFDEQYEYLSKDGEQLLELGARPLAYEMNNKFLAYIFSDIPGFKDSYMVKTDENPDGTPKLEKKNWPTISEQIEKTMRIYEYLAVQADRRRVEELREIENSAGLKEIFKTPQERINWLRKLKLAAITSNYNDLKGFQGRNLEDLTESEKQLLDKYEVPNVFSTHLPVKTLDAIGEAIKDVLRGEFSTENTIMNMQMEMAKKWGYRCCHFFGIAPYYGTHAVYAYDKETGQYEYKSMENEDEKWASAAGTIDNMKDKIAYVDQDGNYFIGTPYFKKNAPERLFTSFFRFAAVDGTFNGNPESKLYKRSVHELWWNKGMELGQIFKNGKMDECVFQRWLLRYRFIYQRDTGVYNAMVGKSWADNSRELPQSVLFWEDVKKAIYIVYRDPMVTNGEYEKWINKNNARIEARARAIQRKSPVLSWDMAHERAVGAELGVQVGEGRKKWRQLVYNSILFWGSRYAKNYCEKIFEVIKDSNFNVDYIADSKDLASFQEKYNKNQP